MTEISRTVLDALRSIVGPGDVVTHPSRLDRNSRDCYWYSPLLKTQLNDKCADVMVSPKSEDQVVAVVALAVRERIPITPRGAGTGNYGQSIPMHGGILLSTKRLNRILELTPEQARVQAGVILHQIELAAREVGAELRFFPSTLPTATAGGFVAGGSSGVGSIHWGSLWDPGNILSAKVVSIEEEPQRLTLSDPKTLQGVIQSCGQTAIISELTFPLAPRQHWQQYVVAFEHFEDAVRLGYTLAADRVVPTRLVSVVDWPLPSFFGRLAKAGACPEGKALLLLHVPLGTEALQQKIAGSGGVVTWHKPQANVHRGALELTDFAWNHATLWAIKADSRFTYLQDEFDVERVYDQLRERKARYGDTVLDHVTFSRSAGILRPVGLTVIRFQSTVHLQELTDFCESIGIRQYSPHTTFLDDNARWNGEPILTAKARWDPHSLLNPGHLRVLE